MHYYIYMQAKCKSHSINLYFTELTNVLHEMIEMTALIMKITE